MNQSNNPILEQENLGKVTKAANLGRPLFGNYLDPILFLLPPLLALGFLTSVPSLSENSVKTLESLIIIIGIIVLDRAHTFATFVRIFGSKEERSAYGLRTAMMALALGLVFLSLHVYSRNIFWSAATYLTVWHVLRQHAGLALYAEDKALRLQGKAERLFASSHLYFLWVGTLLGLHTREAHTLGWYSKNELIPLSSSWNMVALGLSLVGMALYMLWFFYRYFKHRVMGLTSLYIWLSSLVGSTLIWTHDPSVDQNRLVLILSLSVLHSLPYLAASASVANQGGLKNNLIELIKFPRLNVSTGIIFVFVTLLIGSAWQIIGFQYLENMERTKANAWTVSLVETVFMLPVFVHNIVDGWLWKRSRNATALRHFITDTAPTSQESS